MKCPRLLLVAALVLLGGCGDDRASPPAAPSPLTSAHPTRSNSASAAPTDPTTASPTPQPTLADVMARLDALPEQIAARFPKPAVPAVQERPQQAPAAAAMPQPQQSRRPRIYCDTNVTPIGGPGPCQNLMISLGFRPCVMVYDGTLNRATMWDQLPRQPKSRIKAWSGAEQNNIDPPSERAVRAVAKVARDPSWFGDPATPLRPIIFDIEGSKVINSNDPSLAARRAALKAEIDAMTWAKAESGCPVAVYMGPPLSGDKFEDDLADLRKAFYAKASFASASLYDYDPMAETNGEYWFDLAAAEDARIARECPAYARNKVAFVCPAWQIYWPKNLIDKDHAKLADKPVPLDLWKRQIDWLVEHDWDIFVWTGSLAPEPIRDHLAYVAQVAGKR
ncbi:MAG TPA: hypothetical protein VH475_21035 [Tepidisphaeraceae bacterium]